MNRQAAAARLCGITALSLALGLAGCVRDTSDLEQYLTEIKARPSAPIEPIPELKPFDSFSYPDVVQRNPFAPLAFASPQEAPVDTGINPDRTRPRELLEEFALDSLRMMGTLRQQDNLWALIRDPSGTIHRVQMGNYLGQNYGRIVDIDEQQIRLVEIIANSTGGWIERNAALALNE